MKVRLVVILAAVLLAGGVVYYRHVQRQAADEALVRDMLEKEKKEAEERVAKKAALAKAQAEAEAKAKAEAAALKAAEEAKKAAEEKARATEANYLAILPERSLVAISVAAYPGIVEHFKNSAFGQMIFSPALAGLRTKIQDKYNEGNSDRMEFVLAHLKGPLALAFWDINPAAGQFNGALIAEIAEAETKTFMGDFQAEFPELNHNDAKTYKGVEVLEGHNGHGALAMVGRNFIIGSNATAVNQIIDNLAKPGGLRDSPAFAQAAAGMTPGAEVVICVDYARYMELLNSLPVAPAGLTGILKSAGMETAKLMVISIGPAGAGYQENYAMTYNGAPTGMLAASVAVPERPPLAALAQVPATALIAATQYVDGTRLSGPVGEYLQGMKTMFENMKNAGMHLDLPVDLSAVSAQFEKTLGLSIGDVISSVKGECSWWLGASPSQAAGAPDIGVFVTCVDANHAKTLSAALVKAIGTLDQNQSVLLKEKDGVYSVNLAALGLKVPPALGYSPCWLVSGNRIYVASSEAALRRQQDCARGTTAGLRTEPNFVKALTQLSDEERQRGVLYVDVPRLLITAAEASAPFLPMVQDPELKSVLPALLAPRELFQALPPAIASNTIQPGLMVTTIRAPLPVVPVAIGAAIGAGFILAPRMGNAQPSGRPRPVTPVSPKDADF